MEEAAMKLEVVEEDRAASSSSSNDCPMLPASSALDNMHSAAADGKCGHGLEEQVVFEQ